MIQLINFVILILNNFLALLILNLLCLKFLNHILLFRVIVCSLLNLCQILSILGWMIFLPRFVFISSLLWCHHITSIWFKSHPRPLSSTYPNLIPVFQPLLIWHHVTGVIIKFSLFYLSFLGVSFNFKWPPTSQHFLSSTMCPTILIACCMNPITFNKFLEFIDNFQYSS